LDNPHTFDRQASGNACWHGLRPGLENLLTHAFSFVKDKTAQLTQKLT